VTRQLLVPDIPVQRRWLRPPALPAPTSPQTTTIASLRRQSRVAVKGMIRSAGAVTVGSGLAYHFTLVDGSGELDVLFLGRPSVQGLQPGTRITAQGTVGSYDGKLALWNPRYAIEPAD